MSIVFWLIFRSPKKCSNSPICNGFSDLGRAWRRQLRDCVQSTYPLSCYIVHPIFTPMSHPSVSIARTVGCMRLRKLSTKTKQWGKIFLYNCTRHCWSIRQQMLKEAFALVALGYHPHIVRYFGSWEYKAKGKSDYCLYLQEEFCEGVSHRIPIHTLT